MKKTEQVLLVLSPGFAANEADSVCLPAQQQLVLAMNKNFPAVKIIILAFQYPFTDTPYDWYHNSIIPFNGRNRKRIFRLWVWIRVWQKMRKIKKQYTIKGIACFWYGECALVGKLFAKNNGIRHLVWLLGQDARKGNKYAKILRPRPDELVAISDFIVKEFERNYSVRPAHMIPNGISPDLFPEPPLIKDIDVLGVGSLIPLKRYDLFIDIVKQLKQQHPLIKAVICGKGEEEGKLELLIKSNGLTDHITLSGEMPYVEVLKYMQRSKILLHPSSYEGFSGVCLEALYAGAHVISFCNPKNEWISHWYIADDVADMYAIASEILNNPNTEYRPVLPYTMNDSAMAFMKLFG